MIHLIGTPTEWTSDYQPGKWEDFVAWICELEEVQFDIETTVTSWWCDKKVITVQFGDNADEWVIQWSSLNPQQKNFIKEVLESKKIVKLIHNALFECTVMLFHGIRLINVYDTMLAEMVLQGGEHTIGYGLDDICYKRLQIVLDKIEQTTFGDNILTPNKVVYAAQDVKYLVPIRDHIRQSAADLGYETFEKVVELENSIVPAFAEMVFHGMEIDQEWWINLAREAEPLVAAAQAKLNDWLQQEPFKSKAYELGYLSKDDRILINWNSPKQKALLFAELYPQLPGTTKATLKKWQSTQLKAQQPVPEWLPYYIDGDCSELQKEVIQYNRDWLIENQLLIPAETPTINWGSTVQVLPLFQTVEPRLKSLDKEAKGRCSHPVVIDYDGYLDTTKLLTTYGESFIYGIELGNKKKLPKVDPTGFVRTSFKQVLTTGRISTSNPNMQNIVVTESVGNKYRNAFIPPKGWSFVSSDYVSQELIVIAYLSKDPVWEAALSKGQDLHSLSAELVFGKAWKDAAEPGCEYYKDGAKQKCKCKKHKYMRTGTKTIGFGLAYGMSEFLLAGTLRIPLKEAKKLIEDYFKAFPGIGKLLDFLGDFGVRNGYIQTIWPYYRRRWFPNWQFYKGFIDAHLLSAQYHPGLGEIERASKNAPIQGTSADMVKLAMRDIYNYIHENNISHKVHLKMQVHDQLDTAATNEFKDEWKPILTSLMEAAAKVFIPSGLLKADTSITSRWSK